MSSLIQKTLLVTLLLLSITLPTTAQGTQFITGVCKSDADCASACCGFNTGKCAGPVIAKERDGGCGFGGGAAAPAAAAASSPPAAGAGAGAGGAAKPAGTQFITGVCKSDADCASGCCGFKTGKCAGAIIALERDGGCGFGNAVSNGDAAKKLRGGRRR